MTRQNISSILKMMKTWIAKNELYLTLVTWILVVIPSTVSAWQAYGWFGAALAYFCASVLMYYAVRGVVNWAEQT